MAAAADSIRQLTRAYLGARVYQGLIFWWALALNVNAAVKAVVDPGPRAQMWLFLGAVVAAGSLLLGHLGMAAALVANAVQLHLFLVREFRHAHV